MSVFDADCQMISSRLDTAKSLPKHQKMVAIQQMYNILIQKELSGFFQTAHPGLVRLRLTCVLKAQEFLGNPACDDFTRRMLLTYLDMIQKHSSYGGVFRMAQCRAAI